MKCVAPTLLPISSSISQEPCSSDEESTYTHTYSYPTLLTHETYLSHLTSLSIPTDITRLTDSPSPSLCWIGPKTSKSIILYVCGGGFIIPAFPAHISFLLQSQKAKPKISIVLLSHTQIPAGPWPTPLADLVLAINHLLATDHPLSTIHLAGDSSGASLHLALLQHMKTPYPSSLVPLVDDTTRENKFASAFFISPSPPWPWGSASVVQDPKVDIISGKDLEGMCAVVEGSNEGVEGEDGYLVPVLRRGTGWERLRVGRVEIVVGGGEVLRGDIEEVGARIANVHDSDVVVNVCEGEVHCQILVDGMMGVERECESKGLWKKWLSQLEV